MSHDKEEMKDKIHYQINQIDELLENILSIIVEGIKAISRPLQQHR
ncbi:hypothetical protein [Halarsenatibacter silvermanii]|uniref:Uncharacterized protein n=1 Tax=Halarsenatibacter silvermanii TaxID=321763 RepID=A0A1G9TYY6_9FIRM|nr:hypothetical protein [Halarsenatibacter silvermanii]SDM53000.1 hypothetical protein SAMN04488692_1524 [Halarsenatibacter silvermanii]